MYGLQDDHLLQFCAGIFKRDVIWMLLNASFSQSIGVILRFVNLCTFYTRNIGTTKAKQYLQYILTKQMVSIVYKSFENVGNVTCKRPYFCATAVWCVGMKGNRFLPVLIGVAVKFQVCIQNLLSLILPSGTSYPECVLNVFLCPYI